MALLGWKGLSLPPNINHAIFKPCMKDVDSEFYKIVSQEDLDMDGRNILKLLLNKEDMRMWDGSIPLRIEFSKGPCDHGN
jgi:hypothetical protein